MGIFDKKKKDMEKSYDDFRLKMFLNEMKENRTDSITNMVIEELVMRAQFVTPILKADDKTSIPMLISSDEKQFYPIFTSNDEFKEWGEVQGLTLVTLTFDDYAELVEKNEEAAGVVVNPYSDNLIIGRASVESFRTRKDLMTKGVAKHKVSKDTNVKLGEPKEYPAELVEALVRFLPEMEVVNRVWLRQMLKNNVPSLLLVVDHTGINEEVFPKMAEVARPYLKKTYIDMVDYREEFGKKATEKVEPFYKK